MPAPASPPTSCAPPLPGATSPSRPACAPPPRASPSPPSPCCTAPRPSPAPQCPGRTSASNSAASARASTPVSRETPNGASVVAPAGPWTRPPLSLIHI
eukprot:162965-Prymnesium_polylepis.2